MTSDNITINVNITCPRLLYHTCMTFMLKTVIGHQWLAVLSIMKVRN